MPRGKYERTILRGGDAAFCQITPTTCLFPLQRQVEERWPSSERQVGEDWTESSRRSTQGRHYHPAHLARRRSVVYTCAALDTLLYRGRSGAAGNGHRNVPQCAEILRPEHSLNK